MRYSALFLWVALPLIGYAGYAIYGLPHFIWNYSFRDNGDRYNPHAERHYLDCTFWGPYGRFTVPAEDGRCGWIEFFKQTGQ